MKREVEDQSPSSKFFPKIFCQSNKMQESVMYEKLLLIFFIFVLGIKRVRNGRTPSFTGVRLLIWCVLERGQGGCIMDPGESHVEVDPLESPKNLLEGVCLCPSGETEERGPQ